MLTLNILLGIELSPVNVEDGTPVGMGEEVGGVPMQLVSGLADDLAGADDSEIETLLFAGGEEMFGSGVNLEEVVDQVKMRANDAWSAQNGDIQQMLVSGNLTNDDVPQFSLLSARRTSGGHPVEEARYRQMLEQYDPSEFVALDENVSIEPSASFWDKISAKMGDWFGEGTKGRRLLVPKDFGIGIGPRFYFDDDGNFTMGGYSMRKVEPESDKHPAEMTAKEMFEMEGSAEYKEADIFIPFLPKLTKGAKGAKRGISKRETRKMKRDDQYWRDIETKYSKEWDAAKVAAEKEVAARIKAGEKFSEIRKSQFIDDAIQHKMIELEKAGRIKGPFGMARTRKKVRAEAQRETDIVEGAKARAEFYAKQRRRYADELRQVRDKKNAEIDARVKKGEKISDNERELMIREAEEMTLRKYDDVDTVYGKGTVDSASKVRFKDATGRDKGYGGIAVAGDEDWGVEPARTALMLGFVWNIEDPELEAEVKAKIQDGVADTVEEIQVVTDAMRKQMTEDGVDKEEIDKFMERFETEDVRGRFVNELTGELMRGGRPVKE